MAVALSGMGNDVDALEHIDEVLRLSPQIRNVDPAKYDAHFVELFRSARGTGGEPAGFAQYYPRFSPTEPPVEQDLTQPWQGDPAIEILGSRAEKGSWRDMDSDQREDFIHTFWKARDKSPETERNEFREEFERRVAYADAAFKVGMDRGSLTDRGRVFILLGEPARVRRREIRSSDAIQSFNRGSVGIVSGSIEYWVYTREQLPVSFSKPTMTYRFVSHQGVGNFVLQRDGMAINFWLCLRRSPASRPQCWSSNCFLLAESAGSALFHLQKILEQPLRLGAPGLLRTITESTQCAMACDTQEEFVSRGTRGMRSTTLSGLDPVRNRGRELPANVRSCSDDGLSCSGGCGGWQPQALGGAKKKRLPEGSLFTYATELTD